ncbi:hypothetical protein [Microbacterium sp. LMI1x-1-1.1]|uniref:hypothetical protein n=1 Tax=Microbacterium sp. LMI1x-1-1.1 TaxID=3135246 RepID=UPI00342DD07D
MANFDDETLRAVGELIALGEQEGFGITFEPTVDGWDVGFMRGMGGGGLYSHDDLKRAAQGAIRPLLDLSARHVANRRDRQLGK